MTKFTVRVVGTSPVWADIEVEAETGLAARRKVRDDRESFDPAEQASWQLSEGGNGVDDWELAEVFDESGEVVVDSDGNPMDDLRDPEEEDHGSSI